MESVALKWRIFVVTLLLVVPMAVSAQVIYGLENCAYIKSQSKSFFVQIDSFRSQHSARQLQKKLAKRTHYAVRVQAYKQYYVVRVGPLPSVAAVSTVCKSLSDPSKHESALKKPVVNDSPKIASKDSKTLAPIQNHKLKGIDFSQKDILEPGQNWFVGMSVGFMQTSLSNDGMDVLNGSNFISPGNLDHYSLQQSQPILLDAQVGKRWSRNAKFFLSLAMALRYEHVFSKNIQGIITQYSDPEFANYSYNWAIKADALSLNSKVDLVQFGRFMPYFDLGLGVSFLQGSNYNETALPGITPRYSPNYKSSTTSQFTYTLGAGIDFILSKNILLSAGYEYQSFGKTSSGFGQGPDWSNTILNLPGFNTNMGLVGISYLFDNTTMNNSGFK